MAEQLLVLPTEIFAGESIIKTISGLTVTDYSLSYQFNCQPTPITVACVASTDDWVLTVTAAQTTLWKRGTVSFVAYHTNTSTGAVTAVDYGDITVQASPMTSSDYQAAITAIDAAMLTYASNPNRSITVGTIRIDYKNFEELKRLRDYYLQLIAQDTGRGYAGGMIKLTTRF